MKGRNILVYKGYVGVFEYYPDDEMFHGSVANVNDVIHFTGRSVAELKASLQEGVEDYLEACAQFGKEPEKPFSGRFVVRLEPETHRNAAIAARLEGQSLNGWIAGLIAREAEKKLKAS